MIRGLALAVSWLSVLPVRLGGPVERADARRALGWAPVVGAGLGLLAGAVLAVAWRLGAPALLAGLLAVAALALATRGMHLDGLADTADGLGCYGGPQRALAVMRDGAAGPFAVVALVLVMTAQAAAAGALADQARWLAVPLAVTAGRVAFGWCARTGVPAARPEGLGALVAGTQPRGVPVAWAVLLGVVAVFAVPDRPWQGPVVIALAAALVAGLSAHTTRRFGGVTGDVLGAASELAVTVVLVGCAFG